MQYPLHPCARRTRTPPVATLFAPRRHRLVLGSLAPGTYPRRPARTGAGTNPAAAARPQASVRMQRTGAAVPQPAVRDPVAPRIIPNRSEPAARQTLPNPHKTAKNPNAAKRRHSPPRPPGKNDAARNLSGVPEPVPLRLAPKGDKTLPRRPTHLRFVRRRGDNRVLAARFNPAAAEAQTVSWT